MKRVISLISVMVISGMTATYGHAASARCTVVDNAGGRMVVECGVKAKEFAKGSKIKIKSEKNAAVEGC